MFVNEREWSELHQEIKSIKEAFIRMQDRMVITRQEYNGPAESGPCFRTQVYDLNTVVEALLEELGLKLVQGSPSPFTLVNVGKKGCGVGQTHQKDAHD